MLKCGGTTCSVSSESGHDAVRDPLPLFYLRPRNRMRINNANKPPKGPFSSSEATGPGRGGGGGGLAHLLARRRGMSESDNRA